MARKNNSPIRIILPIAVLALGLFIAIIVTIGRKPATPQTPAQAQTGSQTGSQVENQGESPLATRQPDSDQTTDAQPTPITTVRPTNAPIEGLAARVFTQPLGTVVIGSDDPNTGYALEVRISELGVGIETLTLSEHRQNLTGQEKIVLQSLHEIDTGAVGIAVPYALTSLIVNGTRVDLTSGPAGEPVWRLREGAPAGSFEAFIDDAAGNPVVRVERTIDLALGSHDLAIRQRAFNLTDKPLDIRWIHTGPISMDSETGGYGGDKRRVRFGFWLKPQSQAGDLAVLSNNHTTDFASLVGVKKSNGSFSVPVSEQVWPNALSIKDEHRLVWVGMTGRYFGVSLHPLIDPASTDKVFRVQNVKRIAGLVPGMPGGLKKNEILNNTVVVLLVESEPAVVAPGTSAPFDLGVYAGPLSRASISKETVARVMGLDGMVLYNFGGPCAVCTFQWLARVLLDVLTFIHGLTGDWALAIILLVVIVRTCLHPVTRWSQIRLQKFGVQMQGIAPKQQKLREKFKDDPKRMQAEMGKLWKEEGINPAGMLGCLPMFLQTPVWIALYATLFFAVELRHQPAFFGVFQQLGGWTFMADLSRSDNAIPLGRTFDFGLMQIDAINLMPLLLGLVFYFHQKFLTPPTSATLTPEQESTQRMVKIMSVVLFPVFMYAAPSGLALYFITNSTLAIAESKWIRAHMNKHGLLDADKIREQAKAKKSTGLLAKLQKMAEERQSQQQASQRMMKRVRNVAPDRPERTDPKFKRRK
ncbi:MAG: membrane protein insertase YidC [Phycisphaeraceae bacterium]|nr:membrane protein insertase YidC [Phycisphaeraceae bacterium]MCW5762042.1 membrane protein insertase YidC [Phycisphaeraceae bacterium]